MSIQRAVAQRDLCGRRWPCGGFNEHAAQLPTLGCVIRHEHGKWGALLCFSDRNVLRTRAILAAVSRISRSLWGSVALSRIWNRIMFGLSGKMKRLSESDIRMNEQAASVAASVLGQSVEAATRCDQLSTKATQMYPSSGGEVWSKQVPNGTGLPKTFLLAVTSTHVHAIEFNERRGELAPGRVIKTWDRAGFRAHTANNTMAALGHVPGDRQALMLFLPIDGDASRVEQAIAQQRVAAGGRAPSRPFTFFIGTDAASARVIVALAAQPLNAPGAGPKINIGENANIRISPGANITVGGQRLQDLMAQQRPSVPAPVAQPPSTAQRLQELETLRATGAISDDEYGRKRQQIISEI